MPIQPWTLLGKQLGFQTRIFNLMLERWRSPRTGAESTFSVIDSPDWVNVVATDLSDNMIMIRQFRFGTAQFTLEVPGGMVDPGEQPLATAERELYEESGYRAQHIVALGSIEPNPAIFSNKAHMFWAQGCQRVGEQVLDAGEDIEVVPMPIEQVLALWRSGQITHALVSVAIARYELYRAGLLSLDPTITRRNAAMLGEKP
jgi:8-oxo-dGTP pyrophosphatase MutT (NUDIX family)